MPFFDPVRKNLSSPPCRKLLITVAKCKVSLYTCQPFGGEVSVKPGKAKRPCWLSDRAFDGLARQNAVAQGP
jgi:hypothetical protein